VTLRAKAVVRVKIVAFDGCSRARECPKCKSTHGQPLMSASNDDIMRVLGRLEEGVRQLREDFNVEKDLARENRAKLHERLDKQGDEISELEKTVIVAGHTVAQQRDVITGLKDTIDRDVQPTIGEFKEIQKLGRGVAMVLVALGFTAGGIVIWAGDMAVAVARKWLRID